MDEHRLAQTGWVSPEGRLGGYRGSVPPDQKPLWPGPNDPSRGASAMRDMVLGAGILRGRTRRAGSGGASPTPWTWHLSGRHGHQRSLRAGHPSASPRARAPAPWALARPPTEPAGDGRGSEMKVVEANDKIISRWGVGVG